MMLHTSEHYPAGPVPWAPALFSARFCSCSGNRGLVTKDCVLRVTLSCLPGPVVFPIARCQELT
jgi:hypothetical protein